MKDILSEIQAGEFAKRFILENKSGGVAFQAMRKQAAEPYADCWMLEQMLPNPPPIEVESADATPRVAQAAE